MFGNLQFILFRRSRRDFSYSTMPIVFCHLNFIVMAPQRPGAYTHLSKASDESWILTG
jgi:hypothetical protein